MNDREQDGQALQRHSYELSILNDVARALNASVDLPALLAQALRKVAELLGLSTGWVLLFDETSGEPFLAAAQDLPPGLREESLFMAGW
jgi:two-component system NarL family sensor kinase